MIRGIDCASPVTAAAANILKAEGFSFVGRYLVSPESYSKALTKREAEIISAAGLDILCVWETTAARMRGGEAAGREDGARAAARARELEIPFNAVIYFAADFDAMPEDMPAIRDYMISASIEIQPYRVGIYGGYRTIEAVKAMPIQGFWQCVAWSGGRVSEAMTVYQAQWQGAAECQALGTRLGFAVDIDECPDLDKAGMWSYRQPEPAMETEKEETDMDTERYDGIDDLPKWARPTVQKLIDRGFLKGTGGKPDKYGHPTGLDLSEDMIRILVINDRAGVYD